MSENWLEKWNERYRQDEYAYGELPNIYFKTQLEKLKPGRILLPAEGEGRNAVYAAKEGWNVSAFDISEEGMKKAMQLALKHQVQIDYKVGDFNTMNYKENQFDVIALVYAHFPAALKSSYHQSLSKLLRKDGFILFEAFSKQHIVFNSKNEKVGGPKEIDMLFSIDELESDFYNFEVLELEEKEIELNEGLFHIGTGSVIRFVGRKK